MQKVIHDTYVSKIVHDLDKNILIKTLKRRDIERQWFDLYQKLTPSGKCIRPYLNNFFYLPKEKI